MGCYPVCCCLQNSESVWNAHSCSPINLSFSSALHEVRVLLGNSGWHPSVLPTFQWYGRTSPATWRVSSSSSLRLPMQKELNHNGGKNDQSFSAIFRKTRTGVQPLTTANIPYVTKSQGLAFQNYRVTQKVFHLFVLLWLKNERRHLVAITSIARSNAWMPYVYICL